MFSLPCRTAFVQRNVKTRILLFDFQDTSAPCVITPAHDIFITAPRWKIPPHPLDAGVAEPGRGKGSLPRIVGTV